MFGNLIYIFCIFAPSCLSIACFRIVVKSLFTLLPWNVDRWSIYPNLSLYRTMEIYSVSLTCDRSSTARVWSLRQSLIGWSVCTVILVKSCQEEIILIFRVCYRCADKQCNSVTMAMSLKRHWGQLVTVYTYNDRGIQSPNRLVSLLQFNCFHGWMVR